MDERLLPVIDFLVKDSDKKPILDEEGFPTLVQPPITKSIPELIAKGKLKNLNSFAKLESEKEQHDWAKDYLEYLVKLESVEEYNKSIQDEYVEVQETDEVSEPVLMELPTEPIRPPVKTIDDVLEPYKVTIFKLQREEAINKAKVTTSTGKTFDADQMSILRLNTAVNLLTLKEDLQTIPWSTDDVPTGEMVDCTRSEIFEAFQLATSKFTETWEFKGD